MELMAHPQHAKVVPTYQLRRSGVGLISVVNPEGYVMAMYSESTGKTTWQRLLPITQRESVEKWLAERHPVIP